MFFDELDAFLTDFRTRNLTRSEENPVEEEDIIDELLDLYLLAYFEGSKRAGEELFFNVDPSVTDARETIEKPIAGKTFRDRVHDYLNGDMGDTTGTPAEAIARVAETDSVRIYNEAGLTTAKQAGATKKTWVTVGDNKVRDTHSPLDGITVPINADFYTWDDDKAQAPGKFEKVSNNANCRCVLKYSK